MGEGGSWRRVGAGGGGTRGVGGVGEIREMERTGKEERWVRGVERRRTREVLEIVGERERVRETKGGEEEK